MAIEGQFPKVDGDYVFGTEATRFARAGGFIGHLNASDLTAVSSGTAVQTVGSLVINAGSLTDPCIFKAISQSRSTAGNVGFAHHMRLSGTDFGADTSFHGLAAGQINEIDSQTIFEGILSSVTNTSALYTRQFSDSALTIGTANKAFTCSPNSGLVVFIGVLNNSNQDREPNDVIVTFERGFL